MERRLFIAALALAWVTLPLTALNYQRAWNRLPARMAVHFDASWRPNGWTSREGARTLALGMTAFLLLTFTLAGFFVGRAEVSMPSRWVMLAVFYFAIGILYFVNKWIVDRSLSEPPPNAAVTQIHDRKT